jgi:hypothetical protein
MGPILPRTLVRAAYSGPMPQPVAWVLVWQHCREGSGLVAANTRIRILTANFRLTPESDADIAGGHAWESKRRGLTIDLLKTWKPSVICGQECSTAIRADLATGLGTNWRHIRNGNVIVWLDANKHNLIGSAIHMLPSPPAADGSPGDPRRLVLARLQMKATGNHWWAASTHFTPGDPDWQARQMEAAVEFITAEGDIRNTIFGGDFNAGGTNTAGPRTIAKAGGLRSLRGKLGPDCISNLESNSYNGWSTPPRNGFWIDDILTGHNFQPYYGSVINTDGASDHQFILASSIQLT